MSYLNCVTRKGGEQVEMARLKVRWTLENCASDCGGMVNGNVNSHKPRSFEAGQSIEAPVAKRQCIWTIVPFLL